jgi:hypothetical protein
MSKYFDSQSRTFMEPNVVQNGNHMVMTNVYTDTKKKYINIDTKFQEEYNKGQCVRKTYLTANQGELTALSEQVSIRQKMANIQCKLPQSITNVKTMKVTNMELPTSFYNFSTQRGNTFFMVERLNGSNESQATYLAQIPDGNYDFDRLEDAVETQFNQSIAMTMTDVCFNEFVTDAPTHYEIDPVHLRCFIDPITKKTRLSIDSSSIGTDKYRIHFNVDNKGNEDKYNFKSKLGWALGFREPVYEIDQTGTVWNSSSTTLPYIESESIINVYPFQYMYLSIDEFSQSKANSFLTPGSNSFMNSNVIARISLNDYVFGTITYASSENGKLLSDKRIYNSKTDIQRLHIQLLDDFGRPVDLNEMDFSFVLELEYH